MAEVLRSWLADAGIDADNLEQDFASGWLFGKLLHAFNLQPDIDKFVNKGKPDACLNNYTRLQPTLTKLGVRMDTRTAQALINKESGLAGKVLYSIIQALGSMKKDLQVQDHTGRTIQQFGVRTSPSRGMLDAQHYSTQHAAYQSGSLKFFEDVMRKKSENPNTLMESLHLKRFADEGARQASAAAEGNALEASVKQAQRGARREEELSKLAAGRSDKTTKLQRDEAVHAALLKHQDDLECQELRVEIALAELSSHKQQEAQAAAAADAAAGIDAFEMTLKRLGGEDGSADGKGDSSEQTAGPGESPLATLGRIRTFAPTAAKLAESSGEYLSTIKARRQEEVVARREREARRRRLLVDQQAARSAAEGRMEAESLLGVLVLRSREEQKLGQRLWQLRQEKAAMEADRKLREQQYAARREKDWEETIRREAELHRSMKAQFTAATQQELATWQERKQQRVAAKAAAHHTLAQEVAWQLVQLAERVIGYRAATAGQAVPRRDWRAWVSLFLAGDPMLGSPVVSSSAADGAESGSATFVLNTVELQDYLAGQGEWTLAQDTQAGNPGSRQQHALGRVVAELSAFAQRLRKRWDALPPPVAEATKEGEPKAPLTAAEAVAAGESADATPGMIQAMPLKLAVVGSPFAGKTTVSSALAQRFGVKLLVPEQLVTDAVAAAQAWEQQQQQSKSQGEGQHSQTDEQQQQQLGQQQAEAAASGNPEPSRQVLLGQRALQELQQGSAVSDELLVELLLQGMLQAKDYAPPPPEPPPAEAKGAKGAKTGVKAEAAAITAGKVPGQASAAGSTPGAAAAGGAAGASGGRGSDALLPAGAGAAGAQATGFVIDGFPATKQQAILLEKALTGLDLSAEQELVDKASVVAPPPLDVLPQLQRPLLSGLDAVLVLGCEDEGMAVKRALGKRLDPTTGRIYHLEFDPPPSNVPGLSERLVMVTGADNDTAQVTQRLSSYAVTVGPLSDWLCRFSTLRRPLDGSADLAEVLAGASNIAAGMLVAKRAVHSAKGAAEAADRARESAEKAKDHAQAAQGQAEAAARELLAAKRAEIQAAALLTSGKNPDPASAEVLKSQAAAKCADQLKVCRATATDAAGHAERAKTAAEAASVAVQRCKLAVGDAAVSADAEATANKAAVDAEAAANATIEAAKKAAAAKQLSEAYVAEAEKWFTAADVQPDAVIMPAQQLAAPVEAAAADDTSARALAAPGSAAGTAAAGGSSRSLVGPAALPAAAVPLLHEEWQLLEQAYVEGMGRGFAGLREARSIALNHVAGNCSWFSSFLQRTDGKQALLQSFIERFNAVEVDMRKAKETQGELLLRCEELRDALWGICDAKHDEAEVARLKLAGDGSAAEHIGLLGQHLINLAQVELDRFLATAQFMFSYCHYAQGIYNPPGADKPLCLQPTVLANLAPEPSKPEAPAKAGSAPQQSAYLASLQQRLPQLAAALKAAMAAAAATQTNAAALIDEATKKVAAAAATASAAANAATAAAAAVLAGSGTAGAHRPGAGAKGAAGGAAGAAANSKPPVGSEEAAAAAAATAAAATSAVAAMPQPAALAAVASCLQPALTEEVHLLQQRLTLLGTKAAAIVDEVVHLQAAANCQLAEWQQKRYVAECGAVAALEKVVKAAAAAGQPLPHDLRLEDDLLVIDESRLLVPPASTAPPARAASPTAPPGVLSVQQLQHLAQALQQAAPDGFLALADGVELMLRMASQGVLPPAWQDIDAAHTTSALAAFDPTYSGYLDWRELLLALAATSLPEIHTATPADIAAQAQQLAAADGDGDGCLTQQEFDGISWWFEPHPEVVQEALECQQEQPDAAANTVREVERCKAFKQLVWILFQQPDARTSRPAPADTLTSTPASLNGSALSEQQPKPAPPAADAAAEAATVPPTLPFTNNTGAGADSMGATDSRSTLCNTTVMLLYLCPDRDLYQGITKAVAAVTHSAAIGTATVNAATVVQMCYPLLSPELAGPIQRAPLTAVQISAAVSAAAASAMTADGQAQAPTTAAAAGSGQHTAPSGASGSGSGAVAQAAAQQAAAAAATAAAAAVAQPATIKASQLMYSAACERVVTLLLHRYQWKDVYIAARV